MADPEVVTLTFESIPDRIYEIEFSTDMIEWQRYPNDKNPGNVIGGAGETSQFIDMDPPAGGRAYYRVVDTGEDD